MAVIVTTMLYFPAVIVLTLLLAPLDISPQAFLTFGGRLGWAFGPLAWWLIGFLPALAYTAFVYPWGDRH